MRWGECGRAGAVALFCIVGGAFASAAEKSTYGKVDTFEPGKKYSCVPTADHKGWDCTATGKAAEPPPAAPPPAPTSAPPAASVPTAAATAPAVAAPAPASAASDAAPSSTAPAAAPVRSGELPRYLNAAAASGGPAPQQPAVVPPTPARKANISTNPQVPPATSAASAAADAQQQSTPPAAPVAPTPAPPPTAAAAATPVPAPAPMPAPRTESAAPAATASKAVEPSIEPPAPAAPTAPASSREAPPSAPAVAATPKRAARSDNGARGGDEFLALPGDQYVLELAHASSEEEVGTSTPALPRGDVYKLHLRQNGADVWLLVWGSFDDVSAAREARAELAGTASITPGWPRRIGPLQAEVRRTKE